MSGISSTWIDASAWTEITVPADALNLTFKLRHSAGRCARLIFGPNAPDSINDPAMEVIQCDRPRTFSIESGDKVYARIYSHITTKKGRVDMWAGDDSEA